MGIWNLLCRGNWNESAEERKLWDKFYKETLKGKVNSINKSLEKQDEYISQYGIWGEDNPIRKSFMECITVGNNQLKEVLENYRKTDLKSLDKKDINTLKGLLSLFKLGKQIEKSKSIETCLEILNGWATGKGTNTKLSTWDKNIRNKYKEICSCLLRYKSEIDKCISNTKLSDEEIRNIKNIGVGFQGLLERIKMPRKDWNYIMDSTISPRVINSLILSKRLMNSLEGKFGRFIDKKKLSELDKCITDKAMNLGDLNFCSTCFSVLNDCIDQEVFTKYTELLDLKNKVGKIFESIKLQIKYSKSPEKLSDKEVPNFEEKLNSMMQEVQNSIDKIQKSNYKATAEETCKSWESLFKQISKNIKTVISTVLSEEKTKEDTKGRRALIIGLEKCQDKITSNTDLNNMYGYVEMLKFLGDYSEWRGIPGWTKKISNYFKKTANIFTNVNLQFSGWKEKIKACLGLVFKKEIIGGWDLAATEMLSTDEQKNVDVEPDKFKNLLNDLMCISGGVTFLMCFGDTLSSDSWFETFRVELLNQNPGDRKEYAIKHRTFINADKCSINAKIIKNEVKRIGETINNLALGDVLGKFENYCTTKGKTIDRYTHVMLIGWCLLNEQEKKSEIDGYLRDCR